MGGGLPPPLVHKLLDHLDMVSKPMVEFHQWETFKIQDLVWDMIQI